MLTPKAEARLEWILGYYKYALMAGLGCAGMIAVLGLVFLLTVGSCVNHVANELEKQKPRPSLFGSPTSEATMAKERAEIERQLNARAKSPQVTVYPIAPSTSVPMVVTPPPSDSQKPDQWARDSYQGFPGQYDADKNRYQKLKR